MQKELIIKSLNVLKESCQEALDGTWDRTDDGFVSMIELIDLTIQTVETDV